MWWSENETLKNQSPKIILLKYQSHAIKIQKINFIVLEIKMSIHAYLKK